MDAMLNRITDYLQAQSWQLGVLVAAVALISWVLRHRSAHVRYLLWLIVLAKCLVPPVVNVSVPVLPEPATQTAAAVEAAPSADRPMPPAAAGLRPMPAASPPAEPAGPRLSRRQWLAAIWLAGTGVFALAAVAKTGKTVRWLRRQRQPMPRDIQTTIVPLLSSLGLKELPRMWLIDGVGQPFVWGLVGGDIYLPRSFLKLKSDEHRKSVLGHEIAHVLRFDAAINILQIAAQAIFWFHPLVWWANKRIRAEREKCCDEMAIARLGTKAKEYSTAIVHTLIQEQESLRSVPSLAIAGPARNIEERIRAMLRPGKRFYRRPNLTTTAALFVIALLAVPTTLVLTTGAQMPSSVETANTFDESSQEADAAPGDSPAASSLYDAVKAGDIKRVKTLIAQGADVNAAKDDTTLTPLGEAAHKGHAEIVKLLLDSRANVENASDPFTPLYYAIWSGDLATVKALIAGGANVNALPNEEDFPPLVHAIWEMNPLIVTILLDAGADLKIKAGANLNTRRKTGFTPLYWAAVSGNKPVFDVILARGDYGRTIHMAACKGQLEEVEKLIAEGVDVDARDDFGCTPLHWATLGDSSTVTDYLIAQKAEIDATDDLGFTPLMRAHGLDVVKSLVIHGADLHTKSQQTGWTKLQLAMVDGDKEIGAFLLSRGEDINQTDRNGGTLLGIAASHGKKDMVELLIAEGADLNPTDPQGRTPLDMAKKWKHTDVIQSLRRQGAKETLHGAVDMGDSDEVRRLIAAGGDVKIRNQSGQMPLHLASAQGHTAIVGSLIAAGADLRARTYDGQTPLHLAAENNRKEVVEVLIAKGADINATDNEGRTPLWHAKKNSHTNIMALLSQQGAED